MARFDKSDGAASRQFGPVILALLEEMHNNASPDEARGLLLAMGARIAGQLPLGDADTIDAIGVEINRGWEMMDWGLVVLGVDKDGITISHHGHPPAIASDRHELWPKAWVTLLEGAYDAWFRNLGGSERLRTTLLSHIDDRIELRYGY